MIIVTTKNGERREFRNKKEELLYMVLKKMGRRKRGGFSEPSQRELQAAGADFSNSTISKLLQSLESKGYLKRVWQVF